MLVNLRERDMRIIARLWSAKTGLELFARKAREHALKMNAAQRPYKLYALLGDMAYLHAQVLRLRGMMACRFWLWYSQLWIRRDEFHPSLDMEPALMGWMSPKELKEYMELLSDRRQTAHERDM